MMDTCLSSAPEIRFVKQAEIPTRNTGFIDCLYVAPLVSSNGACQSVNTAACNNEQIASNQSTLSIPQPSCNVMKLSTSKSTWTTLPNKNTIRMRISDA